MPSYEELQRRHVAEAMAMLPAQVERLSWTEEQLAAHRRDALRQLVRTAQDRSPWHRRRLAGVDPDTLGEEGLAALPVMTKEDLMGNFDEILTDPNSEPGPHRDPHRRAAPDDAYLLDRYHAVASGGSTGAAGRVRLRLGRRGHVVLPRPASASELCAASRTRTRRALRADGLGQRWPPGGRLTPPRPSFQNFSSPDRRHLHRCPVTLPLDEIVAGLNTIQPHVLLGYPSGAPARLAHEANAGRLRITPAPDPRSAPSRSSPRSARPRRRAWGVPVAQHLRQPPKPAAWACRAGTAPALHLVDDLAIVEPVDNEGQAGQARRAAPTRSSSRTCSTPRHAADPLRDHRRGHRLTGEPCPCGSAHRLIDDPQGRLDDTFRYGDRRPCIRSSSAPRSACAATSWNTRSTRRAGAPTSRCAAPARSTSPASGRRSSPSSPPSASKTPR